MALDVCGHKESSHAHGSVEMYNQTELDSRQVQDAPKVLEAVFIIFSVQMTRE